MNTTQLKKLMGEVEHFRSGGLPDLGKPHAKCGFRWIAGFVLVNGKPERWRENLGHDLLTAQYRAKWMSIIWLNHVLDEMNTAIQQPTKEFAPGQKLDMELIAVSPMDRAAVKAKAWSNAAAALNAPAKLAAQANQILRHGTERTDATWGSGQPSVSPGFKLVAVPVDTSPADVIDVANEIEAASKPAVTTAQLHDQSRKWGRHLADRHAKGTLSDSYSDRGQSVAHVFRKVVADCDVNKLDRKQLEDIRHRIQNNPKKNGGRRTRDTVRTELGFVRAFFQWMIDELVWTGIPQWERWLRADFRSDEYDDDGQKVKRYTIEELTLMYAAAGNTAKLYILNGLNFGWGAKEQSTAKKIHFKDEGKRLVQRYRNKRHPGAKPVLGRWIAWPETWELAKLKMSRTSDDEKVNPKGLAFLSVQNQPLVRYKKAEKTSKTHRYSVVDDAIREACQKSGVEFRGVYALRKAGINFMRKIGGKSVAKMYCQHTSKQMIDQRYLAKRWKKMWNALEKMRIQLQPMFNAKKVKPSKAEAVEVDVIAA